MSVRTESRALAVVALLAACVPDGRDASLPKRDAALDSPPLTPRPQLSLDQLAKLFGMAGSQAETDEPYRVAPWSIARATPLGRYSVDRQALALPGRCTASRFIPVLRDGTAIGIKLIVPPNATPSHAGLRHGDIVLCVNGIRMNSPDAALAAYVSLEKISSYELIIERNGEFLSLTYDVR